MRSFVESLSARASLQPDDVAYRFLVDGDVDGEIHELTFGALGRRARAIGGWLQERGFSGGRALLLYPPGLEFIGGYMGCLFGGVVAVPCPAPMSGQIHRALPRLRRLVADAGAEVVLTTGPILAALRAAADQVPELAALTWIATEEIPDGTQDAWHDPGAGPDSIAFLQYTSGSTSAPRGVMVSHGNLLDNLRLIAESVGHTPERLAEHDGDLMVSWLPVYHDMGLIGGVLQAMYTGRTADLFSPLHFLQKPERWLTAVSKYRPHTSGAPNFAYELCLRRATPELLDRLDLSAWRVAFNGAEPVRAGTLRRFAEAFAPAGFRREAFYPCYGLAEATLMVTGGGIETAPTIGPAPVERPSGADEQQGADAQGTAVRELVSAGRPLSGMTVVVADPELGEPRPDGEVGEIWVSGASVALGYWNAAKATEESFNARLTDGRAGFLRTGDLGFFRDGELYISGRRKDLLIIDGRNHYPQDLELTAEIAHPAVRPGCVAAFSVGGADGERPVLVAEVAPEAASVLAAVETAIRRAVSEEHGVALRTVALIQPGRIFKTSSGKIQRSACRKAYLEGSLALLEPPQDPRPEPQPQTQPQPQSAARAQAAPAAAAAAIESWLVDAVARRAEIDPARVKVDQPISDYGVGSRSLVEIVGELSEMLGRKLEPTVLYEYPTIAGAARAFGAEAAAAPAGRPAPDPAPSAEPVAIVSMACRFPGGADDPEALWRVLAEGLDVVGDPPDRWDVAALYDPDPEALGKAYTLRGGFLRGIDRFDAAFFGISPREAAAMDPQQRLLLETAWETLERAGIVPQRLGESATGVYVGLYDSEYLSAAGLEQLDGHVGTGSAASVASGRIAYTLGLQGPAVTIDTACSSSLVALHLAVQALRGGECDLALAGGATLMVTPRAFVEFSRLRGLSASGRCKPFSADADGMVWAEGCGLLLLKRLSDAQRDGDRILAVIRGTAVNQDGRSQGLSAPNGLAQERVVRAALAAAELQPQDLDYVEAHGTGTPLGDPVEGRALARVFGASRPPRQPLYVGSLKSNLGHTQAAAGVGGVIKTVLAMQHGELPASLHADVPTTQVDWDRSGLEVLSRSRPWPRGERVRRAGVSSFGISGTNAHLILEEAPDAATSNRETTNRATSNEVSGGAAADRKVLDAAPTLFPVSGRSLPALRGQADRLVQALAASPHLPLESIAGTLAHHRTHFERRAVVVAQDRSELLDGLRALASESGQPSTQPSASGFAVLGPSDSPIAGKLAFVFPGQGSQWAGMAADLLKRSDVFAEEFVRCDAALRPHTGWSATAVLRGEPDAPDLQRVDVVQPVLFAVMVSLAALWRSYGVEPDAVVGHSQGEVAAAYVAGALSLPDAAKIVALRSKAVSTVTGNGAMAVVELSREQLEPRLAELGGRVSVAAVNSGRSTVLAGDGDLLDALLADLDSEQVFVRRLKVDYASHSAQVEPLREPILTELAGLAPAVPAVPWYSTVLGAAVGAERPDADYWYRNLREPVRYADAIEQMIGDGFRYFVELSPHPSLIVATQTIAEDAGRQVAVVGSLRRDEDGPASLATSLGELHVAGGDVRWDLLAPDHWRADLPTYAFDGQRHWIDPTPGAGGAAELTQSQHPLLGVEVESAGASRWTFRRTWSTRTADWLRDHAVFGRVVLSGTTVVELCRAALEAAFADQPTELADLLLVAPLVLPESGTVEVQIEVAAAGGADQVSLDAESLDATAEISVYSRLSGAGSSGWTLHATAVGTAPVPRSDGTPPRWPDDAVPAWTESSYSQLAEAGLSYGPAFQGVQSAVTVGDGRVLARLSLPQQAREHALPDHLHPALLDAAMQVASTFDTSGRTLLPVAVGRSVLPRCGAVDLTAVVTRSGVSGTDITVDVALWDADGFPAGELLGVRLRAANSADLAHGSRAGRDLYTVHWTPIPQPAAEAVSQKTDTVFRHWPDGASTEAETAGRAQELAAAGLSELKALLSQDREAAPSRVVWTTRGAVAVGDGDPVTGLDQSALWGLARSARTEHPDLGLCLVDLDPSAPKPTDEALLAALGDAEEPELAIRGDVLLAPRLVRAPVAVDEAEGAAPNDGTVLITGGLGAIGVQIARRLATHGAKRLLLTSRQGRQDPRCAAVIAELSALGAEVEVAACDVADADALGALLAGIDEKAPLRGVVHAAGLLADGVLTEQTPERFAEVLRPKVAGAWNLHRLTLDRPLDLFVLLSSAAGVVGTAGQSNYAAANAFLDQLAHRRRVLGMPGTSVSYGAWSGGGLAAEHADLDRMAGLGFRALAPEHALDLFELSLRRPEPHLVAWSLDLERIRGTYGRGAVPALWRTLLPATLADRTGGGLAERLARLSDAERAERVLALIGDEVAQALGLSSAADVRPDQPLREVGLDSVTALDVRNRVGARIGVRLPATLLFDYPTTARLAEHLLDTVLRRPDGASAQRPAAVRASARPTEKAAADEPVAIVSMACRLPGGVADPEQLWRLLADGRDAIGPFPADRWDVESIYDPDPDAPGKTYTREGGFLQGIDAFDARFFGITAREAAAMDPQQRLLLETAWEALERAGIVPARLAGSMTGVYIGMFGSEYVSGSSLEQLDGYFGTGSALSVASGRLSYSLGLVGPAVTVDTACSSSLMALHMAAAALRSGECDTALVGGATLMVTPQTFVEFSRLRGLSPSGRCRSFSDDADGTGFAEGVGMVVLKRLSDARRDGDEVLAVLRGTAVNQDGRSQGLSVPHGPSQEQVIRTALERSALVPADIDYVEAHGTGTTLGDPIEANALARVFGPTRPADRPLYLGSLKSNLGHLQAAAGLAGLMKVVLSLRHGQLPPTLHAARPSRHVDWDDSGLSLLLESVSWSPGERTRRAGVSAFGISGTNVHVVVEEAPRPESAAVSEPTVESDPAAERDSATAKRLFVLSARGDSALRRQASRLAEHLAAQSDAALPETTLPDTTLPDIAYTLARRRSHFGRRAAVLATDRDALLSGLEDVAAGRTSTDLVLSPPSREPLTGKVAFVFPGHSSRWAGMAVDLLDGDEVFAAALTRCDEAVRRHADWSVLAVLRGEDGAPDPERVDVTQPLLFAVDYALAELWRSLGIEPDAVVGHSLGEIAAAHLAGMLTLDHAAALVVKRGLAVREVAGLGGSLAVELPSEEAGQRIADFGDRLSIAAVNSGRSTTISGDLDALAELQGRLDAEQIPARRVPVGFATHSAHMDRLRDGFIGQVADITGAPAATPLYSTVLGEPVPGDALDADYWFRNLREPVDFAAAVRRLLADGYRYFVEVGPHPALVSSIKAVAAEAGIQVAAVGSLRRDENGHDSVLRHLAQLFSAGHTPDWSRTFPEGTLLDLPTYAFERDRHWSTPMQASPAESGGRPFAQLHIEASDDPGRDLVQAEIDLRDPRFAYLAGHRVAGAVWLPGAAFLEMALEASGRLRPADEVRLSEVRFERALQLRPDEPVRLQLVAQPVAADGTRAFTIASRPSGDPRAPWTRHVTGLIAPGAAESADAPEPIAALRARCADPVEITGLYTGLAAAGIDYRDLFQGLEAGWRGPREGLGRLAEVPRSAHLLHPALLDAAFQTVALPADAPSGRAFVPVAVGRMRFTGLSARPVWATSRVRSLGAETAVLDLQLLDEQERVIADVQGFELAALSPAEGSLFEVRWQPRPAITDVPSASGRWLILADESGVGAEIGERLGSVPHVIARRGSAFSSEGPGRYRFDPQDPEQLTRLLAEAFEDGPPERIVQLFGLDAPPVDSAQTAAQAALLCCTSTLRLVAALSDQLWKPAPRLFLVTRGSQAAGGSDQVTNPQQALGWGFGTALAQEQPELRATLIDLPAEGGTDALWAELRLVDGEPQVALRASGRLVPRLGPTRPDGGSAPVRADRTYLVTGGLGGLGRVVAERLARLGARHVAVLGRSEPAADAAQWISALAAQGVTVHAVRADVADHAGLEAALSALRQKAPALGGIVHAAGVLDDGILRTLTPERIARVLAPKVLGTALLTELVPEADFLVLFSSAAGLLGSAGQSSYAAANAFLDAWAHHLGTAGRAALSLDWGAWSEVGMVTGSAVRAAAIARSGLGSFSPDEGGELFERLLGSARRQLAPIVLDRAALSRRPELTADRPLLAELVAVEPRQAASPLSPRELVGRVQAAASAQERLELLETYLRGVLSKVTGDDMHGVSATTPLKQLDLDSLLLVAMHGTIARELGVQLSAEAATSAADIRGLAEVILDALPEADGSAAAQHTDPGAAAETVETAEVADVVLRPATRDVMRLLRAEQQGTPSTAHNIGFAVRLSAPTTRERLTRMLSELADRHAALRTGIVPDAEHGQQLQVLRHPPGELLRWSAVGDDVDVDRRLRELMELPFDLAAPPLWRFELLELASGDQVLLYGAHHAVSDAQSLVLVMAEIGVELSGAQLDATVTNRDIDRLLGAQPAQAAQPNRQPDGPDRSASSLRDEFVGAGRLDLTLTRPRPATRTFRSGTLFVDMPDGLLEQVTAQANRLAITPAAFCLGTLTVFLARLRDRNRFALAVPVDTRMHVGALDAVGFFGVPVPFAAEANAQEPVSDVLRRTDARLSRVLEKGASFFDAMSALVQEGLYRPDAPLVEVYFNFIRPQALKVRGLEILQAGTGYSDLDLMVTIAYDLDHLRLDYNLDIIDEPDCARFGQDYLALLTEVAGGPEAQAATALRAVAAGAAVAQAAQNPAEPAHTAPVPVPTQHTSIALAATFALGNLTAMLEAALEDDHDTFAVVEAPYHQVLASLQDPAGAFAQPSTTAGLVLLRGADLTRFGTPSDELLSELADEYPAALRSLYERTGLPVVVGFLPTRSPDDRMERWERELASRLRTQPGVAVLLPEEWSRDYPVADPFDEETDALAHLPFQPEYQAAVALTAADLVRALRRTPPKVIAVDGDETLWGGVAGELGPDAVDLAGPRESLARRLLAWRAAGVLLVLVSNNDESTVLSVLERPDSLLRAEHFSAIRAGWNPKFERIEAAADELGLGLDSFLFLDDNPAEIAAMRARLPEVLCVTCPPASELEAFVTRLWPVVPKAATGEDAARADFYRQEQVRTRAREETSFAEFIDRLQLEVDIQPVSAATAERSAQLSRRTNQFNLRPTPLDEAALNRWQRDGEVWTASARDRFGDYGQVGVLVLRRDGDVLEAMAWMLSCRALGRGVEERLLQWLADRAEALDCTAVRLIAENTPRNVPARRLVSALGGGDVDDARLEVAVELSRLREFRSWDEGSGRTREASGAHHG